LDAVEAYNAPFASQRSYWGDHDRFDSSHDDDFSDGISFNSVSYDEFDDDFGDDSFDDGIWNVSEPEAESKSGESRESKRDIAEHTAIDADGNPVLTPEELHEKAIEVNLKFEEYMGRSSLAARSAAEVQRQPTDRRSAKRKIHRSRSPVLRSTKSAHAVTKRSRVFSGKTRSQHIDPGAKLLQRALGNVSANRSAELPLGMPTHVRVRSGSAAPRGH